MINKVRGEWLVDENNEIIKMTLREWIEYFNIVPHIYTDNSGKQWQLYRAENKKERNGFIDIYKHGGCGILHNELEKYMDKVFRSGNADFDVKLIEVR